MVLGPGPELSEAGQSSLRRAYRSTSLIRPPPPLGPYSTSVVKSVPDWSTGLVGLCAGPCGGPGGWGAATLNNYRYELVRPGS